MTKRLVFVLLAVWPVTVAFAADKDAETPEALSVLRDVLEPPHEPYSAELMVERHGAADGQVVDRLLTVRFSPPNLYRREILGDAPSVSEVPQVPAGRISLRPARRMLQLVVEDGRTEWIYAPAQRKAWQGEPADPLVKRFGPEEEFDRLSENYDVSIATGERVAGRSTWLLTLRARSDGTLSRRLWVDRQSSLLLRSESFRPDGTPADSMRFSKLQLGAAQDRTLFRFSPPAGVTVVQRAQPDYLALDEARAAGLTPRLPSWLPSGYVFESLDIMTKGRHRIAHYRFSDGIEVISLFQCPSRVRLDLGARLTRRVKLSVGRGYRTRTSEGNVLSWNSQGWRFVLVGAASDDSLQRMAESTR